MRYVKNVSCSVLNAESIVIFFFKPKTKQVSYVKVSGVRLNKVDDVGEG